MTDAMIKTISNVDIPKATKTASVSSSSQSWKTVSSETKHQVVTKDTVGSNQSRPNLKVIY